MNNDKEIYLRVLADVSFMLEIIMRADNETDTFAVEMLRQRIIREREADRLETDRANRETQLMIQQHNLDVERKSDD